MGVRVKVKRVARPVKKNAQPKSSFFERWGSSIFVLLLLALVAHVLFGQRGLVAMRRAQKEAVKLQQEISQLNDENKKLADEIQALKTDPKMIEKIAREEMGLARPGEHIYKLPPKK